MFVTRKGVEVNIRFKPTSVSTNEATAQLNATIIMNDEGCLAPTQRQQLHAAIVENLCACLLTCTTQLSKLVESSGATPNVLQENTG